MHRVGRSFALFLLAGHVSVSAGCAAEPVAVEVTLQTDLPSGVGFSEVRAELFVPDEGSLAQNVLDAMELEAIAAADPEAFVDGEVVGDFSGLVAGNYLLRVSLFAAGRLRAQRSVELALFEDTAVTVSILSTCGGGDGAGCEDSASTSADCSGGACSASGCVCSRTDIGCSGDSECLSPVSCGIGRCIDGQCFVAAGDGCGVGELCDPLSGCVPLTVLPPDPADCTAVAPLSGEVVSYECDIDAEMGVSDCTGLVTTMLGTGTDALSRATIDTSGGTTLEIVIGLCDPMGYVFHLGNSETNNGRGGDAGTTDFDSELEIEGTVLSLYKNDVTGSGLGDRVSDFLPPLGCVTRRILVRDREVDLPDVPATFAGDGYFRITEPGEELVYLGLNGVITGGARVGSGTRCARIRIYE